MEFDVFAGLAVAMRAAGEPALAALRTKEDRSSCSGSLAWLK